MTPMASSRIGLVNIRDTKNHNNSGLFKEIVSPLTATRYHSLVIEPSSVPAELEVTATTKDGIIMGIRHRQFEIEGVQFHPESVLTQNGHEIIRNFLQKCKK